MGIEGGSNNNEIQNQEIQQATNEQVEQSQALHERNAEELEANSTIDNEGERKQIEGKDEATESQDEPSDSDELAENDKIEEEAQQEPQPEEVQEDTNRDELADDNTIANDVSDGMGDGINEDEEEDLEDDPLAEDDSIDTEEPLEDDSESEEDEYDDLADDDTIETGDAEDDTADDIDEEEEDSLASDDSIEAESDEDEDVEAQAKEDENNETSDEAKETEDQAEESETNEDTDKVEDSEDQTEESETDEDTDKVEDTEDQAEESETDEDTDKAEDTEDQVEEDETDEDTDKVEDTENQAEESETDEDTDKEEDTEDQVEEDETDEDTDKAEDTEDQAEEDETDEDTDKVEDTEDQAEEDETDEDTENIDETEDQSEEDETDEDTENIDETEDQSEEDETDESTDQTGDKPEENESENNPDEVEDSEDQSEGEDSEDKSGEEDESDDTSVDDSTGEETAENKTDDASSNEAADGNSESGNAGSDVKDDSEEGDTSDNAESDSDGSEKDRLEEYSFDELYGMLDQPGGKERVMSMVADFRERYEADMWGMTQEEYQDYKAARDRYEKEQEEKEKKESGDDKLEQPEPSKAQQNAENLLEKFNSQDEKSRIVYMASGKIQTLKDISDQNTQMLHDLKDARQDVQVERDSVMKEITAMNYDGTKESNPKKYEQLCAKYYELDSLSERLDYSIVKTDMNNYDISEVAGTEYRNEGTKKLDGKEIDKAFGDAEKTLQNGVNDDKSIMDAYRLGEKINHDVLPSLDASIREVDSRLTMANGAQESYLREHGCTHEEAMAHPDGQYAKNELYKQSIEKERDTIAEKMTQAVELSTALHDQVPMVGSDCTLKVIDNKNGTVTIERTWDNGGARTSEHKGNIHNSKTTFYRNALERKDSVTVGQNSGSVYGHQFSFQYRGLAFKREDTFGGENVKLKNVAEGGFGNFKFSVGYKRGTEGKMSTGSVEASASLAQFKDTASVVVKDKEYKAFSAEVACMKGSASAKLDSYGVVSAKASAYKLGGDATASIGKMTIGKASGHLGEASASWSSLTGEGKASIVESKNSGSIGNNLTLVKGESKDLDVSTKNVLGKIKDGDISESDVMDAKKDIDSIKDATKGKLGEDISEKKASVGNKALKEKTGEYKDSTVEVPKREIPEAQAESKYPTDPPKTEAKEKDPPNPISVQDAGDFRGSSLNISKGLETPRWEKITETAGEAEKPEDTEAAGETEKPEDTETTGADGEEKNIKDATDNSEEVNRYESENPEMADKVRDITSSYYEQAGDLARNNEMGRAFTDHKEAHVEMVADKSLEAGDAIKGAIENGRLGQEKGDNHVTFSSDIDKKTLEGAALSHDTGMAGGGYALTPAIGEDGKQLNDENGKKCMRKTQMAVMLFIPNPMQILLR